MHESIVRVTDADHHSSHDADGWVRTVRVPFAQSAVPQARAAFVDDAAHTAAGGPLLEQQVIEEVETVISELVANAILHGSALVDGTVRVHWKVRPPRVEVEVTDGGTGNRPHPKRPSPWAASGRGLRIVRSLAHEWGVVEEDDRTTVWAALGGPSRRRL